MDYGNLLKIIKFCKWFLLFINKIIHDLLLGHALVDHFADFILPFQAAGHVAVLQDERAFAGAGEILDHFVDGQRKGTGWGGDICQCDAQTKRQ